MPPQASLETCRFLHPHPYRYCPPHDPETKNPSNGPGGINEELYPGAKTPALRRIAPRVLSINILKEMGWEGVQSL
jgi:hypothetical protein